MSKNENRAFRWFAILTAFATLCLICIGGLVTSHGAGMAVPDWPTSYGYNMFFFPLSQWWHAGNIFYEHSHRLFASGVGFLTIILMVLMWRKEKESSMRWLGVIALFAVILQGVLGGLRVTAMKDEIGIFHAALAQLFFVLVSSIALFQTKFWSQLPSEKLSDQRNLRLFFLGTTLLIFCQLVIAATMRHQHAGLAVPDFPKAYGKWWPDMSPEAVLSYNQKRMETESFKDITAFQIGLHMTHRMVACLILIAVLVCGRLTTRELGWRHPLSKISTGWIGLIIVQIFLGAATIWTNKSADIATTHVAVGALSLLTGSMLTLIAFRILKPVPITREKSSEAALGEAIPTK